VISKEARKLIEEILEAEIEEHSAVDVPATDRPYKLFKSATKCGCQDGAAKAVPEGVDRATFERCVEHVMDSIARGDIAPLEGRDEKQSAFAICTAGGAGAGKGVDGMRKDENLPAPPTGPEGEQPLPPEEEMVAETIEIPATPEKVSYSDMIRIAMDYGFSEDEATAIAQLLRKDFGDPADPDTVYIPAGSTAEGMVGSAAVQGGLAIPEGMPVDKEVKFTGENLWKKLFDKFLGRHKPLTAEARLRGEVVALKTAQAKNRADMMETIRLQNQLIARIAGVSKEELDEMQAETAPPPASAAPAAPVPEAPAKSAGKRNAEEILAQLKELLIGDAPSSEPPVTEAVEGVDPNLGSERIIDPETAPEIGEPPASGTPDLKLVPASRKAMESGTLSQRKREGKTFSTFLGGYIPVEDRRVAGWKRGVEIP
jgi:hypothetical protein